MAPINFEFPSLGDTGEGEPVYPPGTTRADYKSGDRPLYWWDPELSPPWWVAYQLDRPAVAFRCYYPHGSAPCDQATADQFIAWVKEHMG
jgi:hypothetical protein